MMMGMDETRGEGRGARGEKEPSVFMTSLAPCPLPLCPSLVLPSLNPLAFGARAAREEAAVVSHQKIRLDALHHVQRDADDDEQPGAAKKLRHQRRDS